MTGFSISVYKALKFHIQVQNTHLQKNRSFQRVSDFAAPLFPPPTRSFLPSPPDSIFVLILDKTTSVKFFKHISVSQATCAPQRMMVRHLVCHSHLRRTLVGLEAQTTRRGRHHLLLLLRHRHLLHHLRKNILNFLSLSGPACGSGLRDG